MKLMPSCKIARSLLLLAFCSTAVLTQAETTVPNTFVDGTPAEASEVNENFDALAGAIDEGLGGRLVVKSGEEVLGYALGENGFITQQGFYTRLSGTRGLGVGPGVISIAHPRWESLDCSGQAYVGYYSGGISNINIAGLVFADGNLALSSFPIPGPANYWAIPLDATFQYEIKTNSFRFGTGECRLNIGTDTAGYKAVPNDPAVTGIQNKGYAGDEYQGPIYYEVR